MTLGGLALAVGILVDDATVEIENIHRNLAMGKPITRAILDGAQQIAVPAFVSTLAICIVFVPVVFLKGAVQFLFTPMALAVVLAMLTSYFLIAHAGADDGAVSSGQRSRTLRRRRRAGSGDVFWRVHGAFNRRFERLREKYRAMLEWALHHRRLVLSEFAIVLASAVLVVPLTGRDFFPLVDAGQFRLHVRAPAGTRLEETDQIFERCRGRHRAHRSARRNRVGTAQYRLAAGRRQPGIQ